MIKGKQSIAFEVSPYLEESASVVGKKEGEGPLGGMFDMVAEEDLFGENTWEEAESTMQKEACLLALGKAHLAPESIRYLFGGDLLRQGVATSMGVETLQIPMFGLYGACSTSGEALALASMSVAAGYGERMLAVTSSHFGSAEKEFRFPLGYANQRPLSAHWTVTGSGAFIVGKNRSHVRITGVTVGKIVDYGLKDSQNMGACMAPAAADLIEANFKDLDVDKDYYDAIFTGDLGEIGNRILSELLKEKGIDIADKLYDFSEFRAFGVIDEPGSPSIIVLPVKRFSTGVTLYFNIEDGERIVDMLGARLPLQEVKLDLLEKVIRLIKL